MSTDVAPSAPSELSAYVIGEIKAIMGRRDISKTALARRLGVSDMWVGRRIRHELPIDLDDLPRIATALGVEVAVLLPRSGGLPAGTTHGEPRKPIDPLAPRVVATVGNLALRPRIRPKTRRHPAQPGVIRDRPATRIGS